MRVEDLSYVNAKELREALQSLIKGNSRAKLLAELILRDMNADRPGMTDEADAAYFLFDTIIEWELILQMLKVRFFASQEIAALVGIKIPKPKNRPKK